jgi:glucan biosynthesis protein C
MLGKDNTMAIEPVQTTPPLQERQPAVPPVLPGAVAPKRGRLFFLDNLRVLLIILVIAGHLAATYYGSDVWYYSEPTKDEVTMFILISFGAILQAFVIGFFFLIAGYMTRGAYDRKGAAAFLKSRVLRLGIPLLIYDLFINPFVIYIARGLPRPYWDFSSDYLLHFKQIGTGPVWFLEVLLIFSGGYVLWRWLASRRSRSTSSVRPFPASRTIVFFLLALAVVTFVIRIWLPIFWMFEPLNLQMAFFAQYISLFIVGIIAYRQNWFLLIPDGMGKVWLWMPWELWHCFPS